MNAGNLSIQEQVVLKLLAMKSYTNQREISEELGYSLGSVNKAINGLETKGFIDSANRLTRTGREYVVNNSPRRAIILAAGFGMRMIPINRDLPKGLLEVKGEKLIERLIRQLHDEGVTEIIIAVGFMKESFEYLIDKYNVELVVCQDYAVYNNLHTLKRIIEKKKSIDNVLDCTYIIPSDIWSDFNPFCKVETHSWYMISDALSKESNVRCNRKNELVHVKDDDLGNAMIGIAYIARDKAQVITDNIKRLVLDNRYNNSFWEEALFADDRMIVSSRMVQSKSVVEINTYEQLRDVDSSSEQLQNEAIKVIAEILQVNESDVKEIRVLKKGMTNRSFLFSVEEQEYIMRIPGEGTNQLIDRNHEYNVYEVVKDRGLCDNPVYINSDNGYKITRFLKNVRTCDAEDTKDLIKCMDKLREFHELKLKVDHEFDLFEQIELYEKLNESGTSMYQDYSLTKSHVMELKKYIEANASEKVLTHIDAVPDNFLFYIDDGNEKLQLTDWEYAGMQDPHVDIAMFIIYSYYDKKKADELIDIYFRNACSARDRVKIYCYIAVCGLLWSNWSEYKSSLGVEFGEYGMIQYRYAKDYYRYAIDGMKEIGYV